ncbi:MAG: porin [Betaproteobacteria bacterium]
MNKKLLAAAVAFAWALPAAAQTTGEVQLYGRANVTYERQTISGGGLDQKLWDVVDNSSRIGVRGKKELQPGLTGMFQVESRVRLDQGGDQFSSRDSWLGLQGGFGTAKLGRTIGPVYYNTYDYISLHNHDTGTSSDALLHPAAVGFAGFMNNTAWYASPKFGPITVEAAFSRLAVTPVATLGNTQPQYWGVVGAYDQGPLHAAIAHSVTKAVADLGGGVKSNDQATTVAALYDFKAFMVGALYEKAESDLAGGASADRDYYRIVGMVPVGKHEFHANFGSTDRGVGTAANDTGAKQWTLAYNYNITKEFKVYTFYTKIDNDNAGTYGVPAAGADFKSFAVGARYNF